MRTEVFPVGDDHSDGAGPQKAPRELKANQISPADPELYKELLDHMSDGVYIADRERRFLYGNDAAYQLTGYRWDEIKGQSCQDLESCPIGHIDAGLCAQNCILADCMKSGETREAKAFLQHKEGRRIPVVFRVQPIRAADGSIIGVAEIFKDDSAPHDALRKAEAMERLAFLDGLTQSPNRRFLEMALQTAFREYQITNICFGVLLIDLDNFKTVNDTLGHSGGDRALIVAARTLAGALRPTDTVGRWGGDEFLAIVRNVTPEILTELAERCVVMVEKIAFPQQVSTRLSLSVSVGGTLISPGDTFRSLVKRADDLLYESKSAGRSRATTR
jgi:diguanylate cyclase (GGDEF)-like protein/PAS domain S-box-containing protein